METYKQLEEEFAKFTGKKYAVALNSGTSALHLALITLGIKPGDEVIVPDFTFIACAFAVTYVGAIPIFVDCDDTLCIDPKLIEAKITPKTKAIMPVHIYSQNCKMKEIMAIARRHNLKVIEDASEHHAVKLSKSDVACYSLQKTKQIHCEEGGMLVTDKKRIYDEAQKLKTFYNNGRYHHAKLSFNYRMPDSQAKLALESLKNFKGKDWVEIILCKTPMERNSYMKHMPPNVRPFFKPLSGMPMYRQEKGKKALYYSRRGYIKYL